MVHFQFQNFPSVVSSTEVVAATGLSFRACTAIVRIANVAIPSVNVALNMEIVATTICWATGGTCICPVWIIPPHRLAGGVLEVVREREQKGVGAIRNVSVLAFHGLSVVTANCLSCGHLYDGDKSSLAIATAVVRLSCSAM